jgi:predicted ATP-grasp superfamily ATP-dependent carboligase
MISLNSVFLTCGLLPETLAAVRSLGSKGIRTVVAEKTRFNPSAFSKYCTKAVISPDPKEEPERYLIWLIKTLSQEQCDAALFMDEATMRIAVNHRHELEKICQVLLPPAESYAATIDKSLTMSIAEKLGVPVPRTVELPHHAAPTEQLLHELTKDLKYPLVIKPRSSNGSRGIRFVDDKELLVEIYASVHNQYPYPLIQERIPKGPKYDACFCYDSNQRLVASYIQKQVRNYPLDRGPSTVHESVKFPELVEYSKKLLDHLSWNGVADVEFMVDPRDGTPILMEINPRFWSSTHLSVRCGVDFPWLVYQLALGKEVEPVLDYIVGKRGRSTLPGDILHFVSNPDRLRMDPPIWTTSIPDDKMSWSDPGPTLGFFLSVIRFSLNLKMWRDVVSR